MTLTTAEPTPLTIRVPVDELALYAGLTAIASTVLAIAGILATAAYLTAWGVPSLVVRMDPLTAALRSESVIYQFLTLAFIVFGLAWLSRRLAGGRRLRYLMLVASLCVPSRQAPRPDEAGGRGAIRTCYAPKPFEVLARRVGGTRAARKGPGMSEVRASAVIPFPVERVWGLMIQPERMAEWNTEIPEVRDISGSMDRVGGGYRQVWRVAGRRMVSRGLWLVTYVEPLRHREFRGLTPMGPMIGRDWFEPIAEGTRLTLQVEYTPPWGPVGRLLDPLMRAMFRRTVARNARALTALLAEEDHPTP